MEKLEWKTENRCISKLKEHPKNPRSITKEQFQHLKNSIEKFNYVETIVINLDNTVLAGHMRIKAMKSLKRGNEEIEVRVPSRLLTEKEAEEYLIRSNKNTGDWDMDLLANQFNCDFLKELGWTDKELGLGVEESDPLKEINFEKKMAIEISCDNENHQQELYEELNGRGLVCRILTL